MSETINDIKDVLLYGLLFGIAFTLGVIIVLGLSQSISNLF